MDVLRGIVDLIFLLHLLSTSQVFGMICSQNTILHGVHNPDSQLIFQLCVITLLMDLRTTKRLIHIPFSSTIREVIRAGLGTLMRLQTLFYEFIETGSISILECIFLSTKIIEYQPYQYLS